MNCSLPQYLLFTESQRRPSGGRLWRFLLLEVGADDAVTASDVESEATASRAELLALVRGLEAIDRPGKVKLITASGYLSRGLARGLGQWRRQNWHWERFGRRVPIRDADLWQRVDHALEFHTLDCFNWGDTTAEIAAAPEAPVETPAARHWIDEPALLVVPKPHHRRRTKIAQRAGQAVGTWGRRARSLLEPELAPTG